MSAAHHATALLAVIATVVLIVAAAWSWSASRSRGDRSHRFAVDRAVLFVFWTLVLASILGLAGLLSEGGPRDGLHLVYGALGPITLVVAVAVIRGRGWSRVRVDEAMVIVGLVLLAIEARLCLTG
jgi:ABC-type spermidine/putrescine transport system permease subunit I